MNPDAGTRERASENRGPLARAGRPEAYPWRRTAAARNRRERLQLVCRLQSDAPELRRLSDRALRHLLRPWLLAGWSVADLQWALDHDRDGSARTWTTGVRTPGGWLLSRLAAWSIAPGQPGQSPSAEIRAAHDRRCAVQQTIRDDHAHLTAQRDAAADLSRRLETLAGPMPYGQVLAVVAEREIPDPKLRQRMRGAWPALARAAVLRLAVGSTDADLRAAVLALLAGEWAPAEPS